MQPVMDPYAPCEGYEPPPGLWYLGEPFAVVRIPPPRWWYEFVPFVDIRWVVCHRFARRWLREWCSWARACRPWRAARPVEADQIAVLGSKHWII